MLPAAFMRQKKVAQQCRDIEGGWHGLEVCLSSSSLAGCPDAIPGPLQPSLCYRDLHSALLLDPKHPQAKALLQTMVDQAQQARQDAGILAVQGKLQHALQCINCAIENNPLDPSLFLFRYSVVGEPISGPAAWSQKRPQSSPGLSFPK